MQKPFFAALCVCALIACSSLPSRITQKEISETAGLIYYEGKPYTGIVFDMHSSSQPKEEIHIVDGLKEGESVYYDKSGKVTLRENYVKGVLQGNFERYDNSGTLLEKGSYLAGKKQGEWIECLFCNMDISASGDTATREKLFAKGVYENGKRTGKFMYYTATQPTFGYAIYDNQENVIEGTRITASDIEVYWDRLIVK